MTVVSSASNGCKKAMKIGLGLFWKRFNSSKCKTIAKMAVARIKLLRNKREVVVRQMRRDIAMLLESKQDATARIRVEHVIREQNIMAANELIELFCDLIVARLPIITKQRDCPADLKEGISSLIFAAPRCSEIPELTAIRDVFKKKYGKDFVSAATDLRPNAGVNRMLIEKLSVRTPPGQLKLKVLKEIAKEYNVNWDTSESEVELLKPPEERIEGPTSFVSATSLPIKPILHQSFDQCSHTSNLQSAGENNAHFEDSASAAEAAAESAKKAIAAAEVAAYLAAKERRASDLPRSVTGTTFNGISSPMEGDQSQVQKSMKRRSYEHSHSSNYEHMTDNHLDMRKVHRRHSHNNIRPTVSVIKFDESDYDEEIEMEEPPSVIDTPPSDQIEGRGAAKRFNRRHSYNVPSAHTCIHFDESDYDEDSEAEKVPREGNLPPSRAAPPAPSMHVKQDMVHPKLPPDYESLAARFEALKYQKSR